MHFENGRDEDSSFVWIFGNINKMIKNDDDVTNGVNGCYNKSYSYR